MAMSPCAGLGALALDAPAWGAATCRAHARSLRAAFRGSAPLRHALGAPAKRFSCSPHLAPATPRRLAAITLHQTE